MTDDIVKRIVRDFGSEKEAALGMLVEFEHKSGISARIIRCIIVLSKGNLEELKKYTTAGESDWRDMLLWAEEYDFQYRQPFED